mmetsp:Transcript_78807/g.219075  ORF Transcript_78807/g.219075 Transcript_78807/m.219075 type:complete len:334 (-) Transcript_78807:72-1073(-)
MDLLRRRACCSNGCFQGFSWRWQERFFTPLELQEESEDEAERERMLSIVEDSDEETRKLTRYYTADELDTIVSFKEQFLSCRDILAAARPRDLSIDLGPWGQPGVMGGERNAWDSIDMTSFKVRGPTYAADRRKIASEVPGIELIVVDLFEAPGGDIAHAAASDAAGTVERVRRRGETRRLLLVNFRITPLQLVAVWALPEVDNGDQHAAAALLERFIGDGMDDEERRKRLKLIPRVVDGPFVVRRLLGETPAIVGKQVPLEFYSTGTEFEVSVCIGASSVGRRVSGVLKRASTAVVVELAFVLEAWSAMELPERILGGFRITYADLVSLRAV